ncbi:MAG: hypothetical protein ACFFDX_06425 [Candidatus Odinarchaeota archaeon]
MSKLFKLRLSFILLIVGIGLIPTAFLAKGYFQDQVPANASGTLLKLKNEGISYIEEEYKGLCIPEILPQIMEDEILDLEENEARILPIPEFLRFIKNEVITNFPPIINGSKAAKEIDDVITLVQTQNFTSTGIARNQFFNNYEFQDNYSTPIEGVSEYMMGSVSLNYSAYARSRLLDGYTYDATLYPGLITDTNFGRGVNDWLEFYSNAESDFGTNRSIIQVVYNCTWSSGQLQNLSAYIKTYLWNTLTYNYYDSKGITNPADYEFHAQWANISFFNARLNLDLFSDVINQLLPGLEAGYPTPTGISLFSARLMWNQSYWFSFVNDTGFAIWQLAKTGSSTEKAAALLALNSTLFVTNAQISMVNTWLFGQVKNVLVPNIIKFPKPYGYGMNTTEYSEILLYEQWANGTVVPDGLLLHSGYKGIEACIVYNSTSPPMKVLDINKTNISLDTTQALFDETNTSSFVNTHGILKWIEAAEGNVTFQNELISTFNLNIEQINLTNNWLLSTLRYDVIPYLVNYYAITTCKAYRNTMEEFAEIEFYRQWVNGSLFNEGMDIAPFLLLESPIKNFEIGMPIPLNLNCAQSRLLWDENYYYSFVNRKGISIWYEAIESPNHYNTLKSTATNFNLTDSEIDLILDWLIYIRDNLTLQYTQIKYDLPANYYILADWYFMGIMIGAIGFSSVGLIVGVIVLMFQKKR